MKRYLFFWFVLLVLASANGTLREVGYKSILGEPWAHYVSVVTGVVLLGIAIWFAVKKWGFQSQQQAATVGIMWLALTEVFELVLILSNPKNTINDFFHAHNVAAGELWLVLPLWIGFAPVLFYRRIMKKTKHWVQ